MGYARLGTDRLALQASAFYLATVTTYVSYRGGVGGGGRPTSSAAPTHLGSSIPRSHWCKAATVKAASRCSFGKHEFSKSPIAPLASSNNQAIGGLIDRQFWRFAWVRFGELRGRGEGEEGRINVGMGGERRTTTDWSVPKFEDGLVDYFIRERSDERRTDEPLPSSCRRNPNNHIRLGCERL